MLKQFSDLVGLGSRDRDEKALKKMRIPDVIDAHMKWKNSLQEYIDGLSQEVLDPARLQRTDQSTAGRWIELHGSGPLSRYAAFFTVRATHAQCHLLAGQLAEQLLAGDHVGARKLMNKRLLKTSHELVYALIDLERQQLADR